MQAIAIPHVGLPTDSLAFAPSVTFAVFLLIIAGLTIACIKGACNG